MGIFIDLSLNVWESEMKCFDSWRKGRSSWHVYFQISFGWLSNFAIFIPFIIFISEKNEKKMFYLFFIYLFIYLLILTDISRPYGWIKAEIESKWFSHSYVISSTFSYLTTTTTAATTKTTTIIIIIIEKKCWTWKWRWYQLLLELVLLSPKYWYRDWRSWK